MQTTETFSFYGKKYLTDVIDDTMLYDLIDLTKSSNAKTFVNWLNRSASSIDEKFK